ncbi:MAG: HlyD family efflux transporter periplasmic adaptor subunit [Rhodanobacteraceae bacterium]|jgi:HlyD family secretion protein|nr:HlyD family efflux transporter periplasmic adaptor subunit [Rhodanobacteraceae bacterium]
MTRPRLLIALAVLAGLGGAVALVSGSGALRDLLGRHGPSDTLRVSGNIEAHESVLSLKNVQSRIVELPFDEGAWVRRGTLIARVDDADYRQQVAIAQAAVAVQEQQLQTAKSTLEAATRTLASDAADLRYKTLDDERIRQLATRGFQSAAARDLADAALAESRAALERDRALQRTAQSNVALAEANVRSAREALQLAQINEGYTTLTAPIDGVILVRQAELGEVVAPGTPIVTLADLDHVWLRAYVNEPDIGRVHFGQSVVVTTDNRPGQRYAGRIGFISEQAEFTPKSVETYAERVTLVYRIRIDIDNPQHELVPGMPADAEIALGPAR